MVYIFTIQKISLHWAPLQAFLNINHNFGQTCFLKNVVKICWCKIWVISISKSAKLHVWWVYWMKNKCLHLSTFCTFQTPLTLLTNSALFTDKRFLTGVWKYVIFQSFWVTGRVATLHTCKGLFSSVFEHVLFEILSSCARIVALLTSERLP